MSSLVLVGWMIFVWLLCWLYIFSPSVDSPSLDSSSSPMPEWHYVVVMDAGSSGSRVFTYRYRFPTAQDPKRLPHLRPGSEDRAWQLKVEPGLSSFASDPSRLGSQHLKPLIESAMAVVPPLQHSSTPMFVYATAGMRLVPPDQQRGVMQSVCEWLRTSSPFDVGGDLEGECLRKHVQIITGEFEGTLGWLTVNYLLSTFEQKSSSAKISSSSSSSVVPTSFGFLDMGGASAQMAFELPSKQLERQHENDLQNITLYTSDGEQLEFKVFVTTFLGYGANAARQRYVDQLAREPLPADGSYSDPCLPQGLHLTEVASHPFNNPEPSTSIKIHGQGQWSSCLARTQPLLNQSVVCRDDPCAFNGVHIPGLQLLFAGNVKFIGVSEYWYTLHDVFDLGGAYDYQRVYDKAQRFCSQPWESIKRDVDVKEDRLRLQCFKTAWMMTLLHQGLGVPSDSVTSNTPSLPSESPPLIQAVDEIAGWSVSWTLAVSLLHAVEHGRSVYPVRGNNEEWKMVAGLAVLVLVMVVVGVEWTRRSRKGSTGVRTWLDQRYQMRSSEGYGRVFSSV